MRITCLIFLAVMSVVVVTESTPLRADVEKAPFVDSEQKLVRTKRFLWDIIKKIFGEPEATTPAPSSYYGQEEYKLKYIGDYYSEYAQRSRRKPYSNDE